MNGRRLLGIWEFLLWEARDKAWYGFLETVDAYIVGEAGICGV